MNNFDVDIQQIRAALLSEKKRLEAECETSADSHGTERHRTLSIRLINLALQRIANDLLRVSVRTINVH